MESVKDECGTDGGNNPIEVSSGKMEAIAPETFNRADPGVIKVFRNPISPILLIFGPDGPPYDLL